MVNYFARILMGLMAISSVVESAPARAGTVACTTNGSRDHLAQLGAGSRCVTSKGFVFQLAARTAQGSEVWLDENTQQLWGDNVLGDDGSLFKYTNSYAYQCCTGRRAQRCVEATGGAFGNDKEWGLPSVAALVLAAQHGIAEVLPRLEGTYISSNDDGGESQINWFSGDAELRWGRYPGDLFNQAVPRCVSPPGAFGTVAGLRLNEPVANTSGVTN